jgi:hypothetical protein
MSVDDKFGALRYLQACLAETLDQYDEEQLKDFRYLQMSQHYWLLNKCLLFNRSLTSHLFNTSMDAGINRNNDKYNNK